MNDKLEGIGLAFSLSPYPPPPTVSHTHTQSQVCICRLTVTSTSSCACFLGFVFHLPEESCMSIVFVTITYFTLSKNGNIQVVFMLHNEHPLSFLFCFKNKTLPLAFYQRQLCEKINL